jgi:hypothetical protein
VADRSVNVKLKMDVAAYLAGARAASAATRDVDKAARDLRKALNEEEDAAGRVRVAEERLNEARKSGKASASQLAAAEEDLARAHRQHEVATDRVSAANERYIESQKKLVVESKKTSDKVDTEMSRMAKRTNTQFDALKFTAFTVGLPAAAALGAAGVTVALAGAAAGFAALGLVGVKDSLAVQNAVSSLKTRVVGDVKAMSIPLEDDFIGALGDVDAAWGRIAPSVATAVAGSAPAIHELTGAATDLAENAMPGLVTAVQASEPALQGVRTFAGAAGQGLGDFFANASKGSEGAKQGFTVLGGTVATLESRLGTLFANLANGSTGPLRSLDVIVDQLTGGLVDLTAQGSGVMGVFQGFSTAGSGAVTVLRGILAAAAALPPQLTQMVGSFGAAQMIASKFGIDAGKGFEGLGEKIKKADSGTDRFKKTVGGLASGVFNPAFLGVTALTVGLDMLGEAQEKAAQKAAEHADNVRGLLQAYREDGGVVGTATKEYNSNALASKNAEANLGSFGVTMGLAKNAILGNAGAYRQLQTAGDSRLEQVGREAGLTSTQVKNLQDVSHGLLANGGAYSDVKDKVEQLSGTQITAGRAGSVAVNQLTDAQKTMIEQLFNANGAVGEQIRAQRDAQDAYYKSESALTGLSEAQVRARDATVEHTQAIYDQVNASLGYRGAVLNVQQALENYNKVLKDGKSTALERSQAEFQLEQAMQQQIVAAGKAASASAQGATDKQKEAIATAAMNAETVKLAGTFSGPLPASLQQTIGKLDATSATAAGLKLGVNKLGEAVYILPNGKYIKIESSADQERARVQSLIDRINAIPTTRKSQIEIVTIYKQVGTAATRTGNNSPDVYLYGPHSAAGGLISKSPIRKFAGGGMVDIRGGGLLSGPGSGTSDSIVGMSSRGPAAFSDTEFVVNAADTKRALPLLDFINNGGLRGYSGGGLVDAAREALGQVASGGQFFEDFSFYGNSANMSAYNDQLAKMYNNATGADFNQDSREPISAWLQSFIAGQAAQQSMVSGNTVQQVPQFASSAVGGGGGSGSGNFTGSLYLDNGTFMGVVRGEIKKSNRGIRRSVTTGSGGNR